MDNENKDLFPITKKEAGGTIGKMKTVAAPKIFGELEIIYQN